MKIREKKPGLPAYLLGALLLTAGIHAQAALVVYSAADAGANNRNGLINSNAQAALFAAATPGGTNITFETALPSGVTITGGTTATDCGDPKRLFGFNTTLGGANFRCLVGGTVTFTFANAIDSFGLFITGLQSSSVTNETLTFSDGSSQSLSPASVASGGAFLGFTDFGKSIVSVSFDAAIDIVGLDDIRYHVAAARVPEPASGALFGIAALAVFCARRRLRKQ